MIPTEAVETQTATAVETPARLLVALVHPTPATTHTAAEILRLAAEELAATADLQPLMTTPAAIQDRRLQVATPTAHLVTPGPIATDLATLRATLMALATLEVIATALATLRATITALATLEVITTDLVTLGATLEVTIIAPGTREEATTTAQLGS